MNPDTRSDEAEFAAWRAAETQRCAGPRAVTDPPLTTAQLGAWFGGILVVFIGFAIWYISNVHVVDVREQLRSRPPSVGTTIQLPRATQAMQRDARYVRMQRLQQQLTRLPDGHPGEDAILAEMAELQVSLEVAYPRSRP